MDADARRLALAMPEATENSHFHKPDFRVRNRIFMTLPMPGRAVLKLTPDQQEMLVSAEPAMFAAVEGGWGRQGWTAVNLSAIDEITFRGALRTAWLNVAPPALRKLLDKPEISPQ